MCFDRNINENRDVKFLECDYLLVQQCVKLTLVKKGNKFVIGPKFVKKIGENKIRSLIG